MKNYIINNKKRIAIKMLVISVIMLAFSSISSLLIHHFSFYNKIGIVIYSSIYIIAMVFFFVFILAILLLLYAIITNTIVNKKQNKLK
jgi:uncharacterized membrane protein